MNCDEIQHLAAAHALGALDPASTAALKQRLVDDPAVETELTRFHDVAAAVAGAAAPLHHPSGTLRRRILDQIRHTPQTSAATEAVLIRAQAPAGFQFMDSDAAWQESGVPGIQVRILSVNVKDGYRVLLGKISAGTRLPRHIHRQGPEELFVISGDLISGGRTLHAGDFMHADVGTHHDDVWSPSGCIALLIEPVEGPEIVIA